MPEISHIQEFLVLSETGSYVEASERLFVSQSSLTRHIQSLEESLGTQLLDRTTRKVVLNQYGRAFLPYAQEISRIRNEYTTVLSNMLNGIRENISIGSIPLMIPYGITDVIAQFRRENSEFSIDVMEADSLVLVKMLRQREFDFAFINDSDDAENEFTKLPYTSDSLVAIVHESHELADEESIALTQLIGVPLLLLSKETFMYPLCVNECRKAGFEPRVVFTGRRVESIIDLVAKGMGVALLNKYASASLLRTDLKVLDIVPDIKSTISFVYPKDIVMSVAAKRFLDLVRAYDRLNSRSYTALNAPTP